MRAPLNERGVILIALLWILTALAVIALSFSRESFVEVAAARNSQELADSYFVARAGLNAVIYQLLQRRFIPRVQQLELDAAPDPIDIGKVSGGFGDGVYDVEVQDESGKINPTVAPEDQLRALVEAIGISKRDGDIIVDSIIDWRDVDSEHHTNGAEDDYYQSLNPPYKAKNGRIDTVEELLLVRGVTREYFYGFPDKAPDGSTIYRYGLSRYLTVYYQSNRVNVNFAEIPVLMSIPGMAPDAAQLIYERRKVKPFKSVAEITKDLPVMLGANTLSFLSTDQTTFYTLTASAHRENSKVRRVIRAVVNLDPRSPNRYTIVYWNENVPEL